MDQNKYSESTRHVNVAFKFLENLDSGIIVLNQKLEILFWNRWLEFQTGKKASDVYLKTLDSLYPSIKSVTLKRKINTALHLNSPTFYTSATSGHLIPIKLHQLTSTVYEHMQQDVTITPFDHEKNEVMLSITDQTNMASLNKRTQNQLHIIQDLNQQLVQEREVVTQNVLLVKFYIDGTIYDVSNAYLKLVMYERDEFLEQNIFELEKFCITLEEVSLLKEHMIQQSSVSFEHKLISKAGREYWVRSTLIPEYDTQRVCKGFTLLRVNITDKKRVQEQQEQLLYQSRNAAMGEMISMIAHQWRQPLTLINAIMIGVKVDEEFGVLDMKKVQNSFEKIETTVKSLSDTIDDFKNFFKPGKEQIVSALEKMLEKSIFFLAPLMEQREVSYKIQGDISVTINAYENELIQVFINIIKNALDEFESCAIEREKHIIITVTEKDAYVMIEIEDNAGGIPSEHIQRIFEPYFSTKSKNGTGLGLYMSKMIIQEHFKGHLSVKSAQESSCFIIEIPK